ncbi:MAG: MaoC family dehydratase [Thiothrix sp.]|nr:MaoC family dehydratase [Thiothrix sp.]HPQ95269.1 MaoC family dehydratase [Thiolinea sp.]
MSNIRQRAAEGLHTGDQFTITRCFTAEEITAFASLSRDYNPVHCDSVYAELKGLRAPITHGLLTASLITEIGGQIGWLAKNMSLRFKRPVYAGETLTCDWIILDIDDRGHAKAAVRVINDSGITVLEAETTGVLPNVSERQHLAKILAEGDTGQ